MKRLLKLSPMACGTNSFQMDWSIKCDKYSSKEVTNYANWRCTYAMTITISTVLCFFQKQVDLGSTNNTIKCLCQKLSKRERENQSSSGPKIFTKFHNQQFHQESQKKIVNFPLCFRKICMVSCHFPKLFICFAVSAANVFSSRNCTPYLF